MLPKSYQEVEYLESSGVEYIDTGFIPSTLVEFEINYQHVEDGRGYCSLFGDNLQDGNNPAGGSLCLDAYNANGCNYFSGGKFLSNGGSSSQTVSGLNGIGTKANAGICKAVGYEQDELLYVTVTTQNKVHRTQISTQDGWQATAYSNREVTPTYQHSVLLFATRKRVSTIMHSNPVKVYGFSLSEDGEQKVNLIPVYRKYDEKPGMYDTVRGMFLTNQGEGEFVTGPPVYPPMYRQTHPYEMGRRRKALISAANNVLPSEYKRVEYLESTGTQWIDTGIKNIYNVRVEACLQPTTNPTTNRFSLFGVNNGINVNMYKGRWQIGGGEDTLPVDSSVFTTLVAERTSSSRTLSVNGDTVSTSVGTDVNNKTLWLGKGHEMTIPVLGAKYASCKIWVNDSLERNLIPCYRKSDNKPGMFDTVSKQFLTNQGTGEFVLGPEV